jgi:uncharacterized membrane protein YfcA
VRSLNPTETIQPTRGLAGIIAASSGFLTGIAAGFIGVGGGEFRIPVLVDILALPLKVAAGINLVIGLFTVALSVYRRWGQQALTGDDAVLVGTMGILSVIGAIVGVFSREKLSRRRLKVVVSVYLTVIGLWMLYESIAHTEHVLFNPTGMVRVTLAALLALTIAIVSGVLGVAGGEMRIPVLLYLFAIPLKSAGTLSLMISIPTLAAGAFTDHRLGNLSSGAVRLGVLMGLASAGGVVLGAAILPTLIAI